VGACARAGTVEASRHSPKATDARAIRIQISFAEQTRTASDAFLVHAEDNTMGRAGLPAGPPVTPCDALRRGSGAVDGDVDERWTSGNALWIDFYLTAATLRVLDRGHHNIWEVAHGL
jgi:hypothetical protein